MSGKNILCEKRNNAATDFADVQTLWLQISADALNIKEVKT